MVLTNIIHLKTECMSLILTSNQNDRFFYMLKPINIVNRVCTTNEIYSQSVSVRRISHRTKVTESH